MIEISYSLAAFVIVTFLACASAVFAVIEHAQYERREQEIEFLEQEIQFLRGVIDEVMNGREIKEFLDGRWTSTVWNVSATRRALVINRRAPKYLDERTRRETSAPRT